MVDMSRTSRLGKRFFWRMGFEPAFSTGADLQAEQGLFLGKKVV
jgi:hypothetical protein